MSLEGEKDEVRRIVTHDSFVESWDIREANGLRHKKKKIERDLRSYPKPEI